MDNTYLQDEKYLAIRTKKRQAVLDQNYEIAANARDEEVTYVLEQYGINLRTNKH